MQHRQFLLYGVLISAIFALGVVNTPMVSATEYKVSIVPGSSVPGCEEFDECYDPTFRTINVGDTVIWRNDDSAAHTVTSGAPWEQSDFGEEFDSSLLMGGTSFAVTFDDHGVYPYFCMVHPWMYGEIAVDGGGIKQPPPEAPPDYAISIDEFCSQLHSQFDDDLGVEEVDNGCQFFAEEYGTSIDKREAEQIIKELMDDITNNPPPEAPPDDTISLDEFCVSLQNQFDEEIGVVAVDDLCVDYRNQYGDYINSQTAQQIIDDKWAEIQTSVAPIPTVPTAPPTFDEYEGIKIPKGSTPVVYDVFVYVDKITEIDRINRQFSAVLIVEIFANVVPDFMSINFMDDSPLHVDTELSKEIKSVLNNESTSVESFADKTPKIQFANKVGDLIITDITSDALKQWNYGKYKIEGKFLGKYDFHHFPFERLILPIQIEGVGDNKNARNLAFSNELFLADMKSNNKISGLELKLINSTNSKEYHKTSDFGSRILELKAPDSLDKRFKTGEIPYFQAYVEVIGEVEQPAISFLKNIFPVILMTTLAVIVFWLPKIEPMRKIELAALFLISVVFFTQLSQIENSFITQFTAYDGVILSSYVIFLVAIVIPAVQMKLEESTRIANLGRIGMIIAIILSIIWSISGYLMPYSQ